MMFRTKTQLITPEQALPGRGQQMPVPERHAVLNTPLKPPFPEGFAEAVFAMGCFWGAEQQFWSLPGVYTTAVGYVGGFTPNPSYEEVCSGRTGHTEAVLVVFDPTVISYDELLRTFWEHHNAKVTTLAASTARASTPPTTSSEPRRKRHATATRVR